MKKTFIACLIVALMAGAVFAQQDKAAVPQTKTFSQQMGKYNFVIEFTEAYMEGRIYCSSVSAVFDEGEAMNAIIEGMQKFVKDNGYVRYKYILPPRIKSDNVKKVTYYEAYALFETR